MNNVSFLREQKGMTQDEFAEFCNVSRISIARYETGAQVSSASAIKIAEACKVSMDFVLGRTESENKKEPANPDGSADHASIYSRLTPENQKKADSYLDFLLTSQEKPDT